MKGSTPAFRCSRCRHTFELEVEEPSQALAEPQHQVTAKVEAPVQDQELSFSFPSKDPVKPAVDDQLPQIDSETPPNDRLGRNIANEDQWSLDSQGANDEVPFTLPELSAPAEKDASFGAPEEFAPHPAMTASNDEADSGQNILPMSHYMDQQASILTYLTLFALLVIGFSFAAVITYAHPTASEELIKKIPLFGSAMLKNSHLKNGILLQSLRGGYQSIQGNREVFVVTGVAFNQNPVVIREIQLTGKIHNEGGKELEEQTVWVGNTLSAKILRGMTLEDIPHLQSLKPLKSFEMPPGDSVPFAIVFLRSTRGVKDFSCAVTFADADA